MQKRPETASSLTLPHGAVWPDYGEQGLLGLVTSIRDFLDGGAWRLPGREMVPDSGAQRLVFLIIDGLGDAFLQCHGVGSSLLAHRLRRMTSVFPTTTASAITTVMTGLAPAAHGLSGWFIHDHRFGGVLAPLPLLLRTGGEVQGERVLERLFPYDSLFMGRSRPSVLVAPEYTAASPYSQRHSRGGQIAPYNGLEEMVDTIARACLSFRPQGGGVYAYYPTFDSLSHDHGCQSQQVIEEFWRIDRAFARLCHLLEGCGVDIVISADHGFIDSPETQHLHIESCPELVAMLDAPLFGERRAAYCQVHPGLEQAFEHSAAKFLAGKGLCIRSAELLAAGLFGPGSAHPDIHERIGTHTLLMEPGWTIYDTLPGEQAHPMLGVHGGITPQEMWIPLVHTCC